MDWFARHGFKDCIPMTNLQFGLATSLYPIGGLVGSFCVSYISEFFGRKRCNLISAFFFFIGSLLETFSNSRGQLYAGRLIVGLAAGASLVNSPLYLNEIATSDTKGFLGTFNQIFTNTGILFTQFLAIWLATFRKWRFILLVGVCIAAVNILLNYMAVESPKWLIKHGKMAEAQESLELLRRKTDNYENSIQIEINGWIEETGGSENNERTESLFNYLYKKEYRRSRMVATIILLAQQFSGVPAIMFYGVSVVSQVLPAQSLAINCIISIFNLVFTGVASLLIDRVGRKVLLLVSNTAMCICTLLMAVGLVKHFTGLTVAMVFIFISFFAIGMGPIPFLFTMEVTQLRATTPAQSYGTSMNWIATIVIGYVFPILNAKIGGYVFLIFTGCCFCATVLIILLFPETKGKATYNQVWNIENSSEGQEEVLREELAHEEEDLTSFSNVQEVSVSNSSKSANLIGQY